LLRAGRDGGGHLNLGGKRHFRAEHGENGQPKDACGANGDDFYVDVPAGTIVYAVEEDGARVVADLDFGDVFCAARGGKGGKGNRQFQSSTNRTPYARKGAEGDDRMYVLELKSIADVGLVGFPNAGKSTLLRCLSDAKPRVASYPFTTLHPVIGVVDLQAAKSGGSAQTFSREEDESAAAASPDNPYADTQSPVYAPDFHRSRYTVADLPGILEDAHRGRGLGLNFLRHIERTHVLAYVLDMSSKSPLEDLRTLFGELDKYMVGLRESRASILVANKLDKSGRDASALKELFAFLDRSKMEMDVYPCVALSCHGVEKIKIALHELILNSGRRKRPFKITDVQHLVRKTGPSPEESDEGEEATP